MKGIKTIAMLIIVAMSFKLLYASPGSIVPKNFLSPKFRALDVSDIDGDGHPEFVIGTFGFVSPRAELIIYSSTQHFRECLSDTMGITAVKIGDVNGDGQKDIVVYMTAGFSHTGVLKIFDYSAGNLIPLGSTSVGTYVDNQALAIADFDNDGHNEIIVGSDFYGRAIYVYKYLGGNNFRLVWQDPIGSDVRSVAVGDVDGDGRNELVVGTANWGTWSVRIYKDGSLIWENQDMYHSEFMYVSIGDLDGDGTNEIACGGSSNAGSGGIDSGFVAVYKYTNGSFSRVFRKTWYRSGPGIAAIMDVDNDGHNELVVVRGPIINMSNMWAGGIDFSTVLEVYENYQNSQGVTIDYGTIVSGGAACTYAKMSDINGDGQRELVLLDNRQIVVLKITPTGISEEYGYNYEDELSTKYSIITVKGKSRINFVIPVAGKYDANITDITGRIIKRIYSNKYLGTGEHDVYWNGTSDTGERLPAGTYFLIIKSRNPESNFRRTIKLQLVR